MSSSTTSADDTEGWMTVAHEMRRSLDRAEKALEQAKRERERLKKSLATADIEVRRAERRVTAWREMLRKAEVVTDG